MIKLKDLEIDLSYNRHKDSFMTINEELYTVEEAYELAKILLDGVNDILCRISSKDIKESK